MLMKELKEIGLEYISHSMIDMGVLMFTCKIIDTSKYIKYCNKQYGYRGYTDMFSNGMTEDIPNSAFIKMLDYCRNVRSNKLKRILNETI